MSLVDNINKEFELLEKNINGQSGSALFTTRKQAFSAFQKLGIPSNRHEEWKYTHIKTKLPESLTITAKGQLQVTGGSYNSFANIKATKLVLVSGVFNPELSTIIEEKGVTAGSLKENLASNKELSEKYYNKLVHKYEEHFSLLNTAFATDGAFIHVKKGTQAKVPVFIIHIYNSPENFAQSRNLIVVEEGADINIVVDFQNAGAASFYNHVSEVFIGKNASANVVKLQSQTTNATAVHTLEADVDRDAKFSCTTISLEGTLIRNSTNVRLSGENTETHLNGLYYGKGKSLIDNHILVDHLVPNCQSNQLYKGVLDDEAVGVFNGKILVKPDAQKTNSFQSSKAILLSDNSSVNSKPQLEIFADDVKCSHGAAIGQLNENEIFYLKARGISEANAKSILTYAFANEIIQGIVIDELREYLDQKIKTQLGLDF